MFKFTAINICEDIFAQGLFSVVPMKRVVEAEYFITMLKELIDVVIDDNNGPLKFFGDFFHKIKQLISSRTIKSFGRFIKEEEERGLNKTTCERRPLFLASGEFSKEDVFSKREVNKI